MSALSVCNTICTCCVFASILIFLPPYTSHNIVTYNILYRSRTYEIVMFQTRNIRSKSVTFPM